MSETARWSIEKASEWYARQPWLVGCNFIPSTAINQLEMWQYVQDVMGAFARDERVLFWDLYNEPGNSGNGEKSLPLVKAVFQWVRAVNPIQPLSVGVPLICTEWMARTRNSLVSTNLPVFARDNVGCLNWGLVAGKSNTIYPWRRPWDILNPSKWFHDKCAEPPRWFHDLFRADGTPYDEREIELFRKYTGRGNRF